MYEEVIYSYFNTIGDYVWRGTKTGENIIPMNWVDSEPTNIMTTKMYLVRKRLEGNMKKEITVKLTVEIDDSEKDFADRFIKHDLEQEIACCSHYYEVENITIKDVSS